MNVLRHALVVAAALTAPVAQAGILEDLLAIPAIQSLLGRQPDLQATVKRCTDAKYRQANTTACQQAEQAERLAKMPPELRAVLAVPASAGSIRELCLAAQGGPKQNSHLCAELSKADSSFQTLAEQQRKAAAAAAQARKDAEALSNRDQIN
jgi:hypothetical protein